MERFYTIYDKRNMWIILIIILSLILSTIGYIFFIHEDNKFLEVSSNVEMEEIDDEIKEYNPIKDGPLEGSKKTRNNESTNFSYTLNSFIRFKASKSLGDIKIENPGTNKYNFFVVIKLKDKEEVIYKSPILKPNQHIDEDYLIAKLDKGTYEAIATIFVTKSESNDENESITQCNQEIKIKIS